MAVRFRPWLVLLAAGLALSGCIDVECPAEFARPISRERYCGHTGDYAVGVTYRTYGTAAPAPVAAPVPQPVPVEAQPAPANGGPTR
jgi:hypothetical protein